MQTMLLCLWLTVGLIPYVLAKSGSNNVSAYFGGSDNGPYLDWVTKYGNKYNQSLFLASTSDPSTGTAVHWRTDHDQIYLAVAAQAQGWVALGFSENGGMDGSDVVYMEAKNPNKVVDAYILDNRTINTDDCQDWTLLQAFSANGFLIFEASRFLDTGDFQDRVFLPDAKVSSAASRVISAWGDSSEISYHGPDDRTLGQVRWFGSKDALSFQELMFVQAEGHFELRANDYAVNTSATQYIPFCMSRTELVAQGVPMSADPLYLIGFEPLIDPRAVEYVHHFTVNALSNGNVTDCSVRGEFSLIYAWAPGEPPLVLPDDVGMPFGDSAKAVSLRMVTHYNNPTAVENILDGSGVRYYYTTKPRKHELGIMAYGDPTVSARGKTVGDGLSAHVFECPSSCSSLVLREPVTVLREFVHMHKTGIAAKTAQLRDDEVVRNASIDFFNFNQQGNQEIQQEEYQVLPGDGFRVTCNYNSTANVVFGLASDDEMCMVSLHYYPRQTILDRLPWSCPYGLPLPVCSGEYPESRPLGSESELGRTFGQANLQGACPVTESKHVDETPTNSQISPSNDTLTFPTSAGMLGSPPLGIRVLVFFALVFYRRRCAKKEHLIVPLIMSDF